MSPFCPGLTLAACPSSAAFDLRREIRARFDAGQSRDVVYADLVERFGPEIKGTPDASGLGAVVWLAPVVVAGVLGVAVRFATRANAGADEAAATQSPSIEQLARLDEELEEFE